MRTKKLVKSATITVSPQEYLKKGIDSCEEKALNKLRSIAAERNWENLHIICDSDGTNFIYILKELNDKDLLLNNY